MSTAYVDNNLGALTEFVLVVRLVLSCSITLPPPTSTALRNLHIVTQTCLSNHEALALHQYAPSSLANSLFPQDLFLKTSSLA